MIGAAFDYKPVAFSVGSLRSTAGKNEGSCKILSFALVAGLDAATTLQLFGSPYRDVLATPEGDDHGNIRNLMKSGLDAVRFPAGVALASK
ncbi:HopJ type III effector protein [Pelagophyceae sp. CCMP2097]|nr:HopJ type III effector protein [Pelagophyceae sp. CCMP2097]